MTTETDALPYPLELRDSVREPLRLLVQSQAGAAPPVDGAPR